LKVVNPRMAPIRHHSWVGLKLLGLFVAALEIIDEDEDG
jgi:hypothetical protein